MRNISNPPTEEDKEYAQKRLELLLKDYDNNKDSCKNIYWAYWSLIAKDGINPFPYAGTYGTREEQEARYEANEKAWKEDLKAHPEDDILFELDSY